LLNQSFINGIGTMEASVEVARALFPKSNESYRAPIIRHWYEHFLLNGERPVLWQGRHQKVNTLIDDEDVQFICRSWLRGSNKRFA
jgi:hypothetical protein